MSPTTPFHDHHANAKTNNALRPPPLKINKDSHMIKKSSSSSLSSSSSSSSASSLGVVGPTKPRHPVIIYTHSPKVIHTHPKDFMALVQKLTGLSDDHHNNKSQVKQELKGNNNNNNNTSSSSREDDSIIKTLKMDDNESSSVITDENCGGSMGDGGQVNSCFVSSIFDPLNPYITNIPVFTPNSADFLCANPPFYNYTNSLFFSTSSVLSSPNMEGMN